MLFSRLPERKRPGTAVTLQSRATWDGWWTPGSIARLDLETTQCLRGMFVLKARYQTCLIYLDQLSEKQYLKASGHSYVSGVGVRLSESLGISPHYQLSLDLKTSLNDKLFYVIFQKTLHV